MFTLYGLNKLQANFRKQNKIQFIIASKEFKRYVKVLKFKWTAINESFVVFCSKGVRVSIVRYNKLCFLVTWMRVFVAK